MKNEIVEKGLIDFIKEYSAIPCLYWFPLIKLKKSIPVIAYNLDELYKNDKISLLEKVLKSCEISNVNTFQMDHREYFEGENIFELLYEKDEDGYTFPWSFETFYFDSSKTWLIYVSHEGTISFTGKKIAETAEKIFTAIQNIGRVS